MPRTKEQNMEIRRQRKEKILKAALQVYVEKGYAATEIGDVAKQAGLARGLVYYYFEDKLSLFRELFIFMTSRALENVRMYFSKEEPVLTLLENYVRLTLDRRLKERESALFFMRIHHDLRFLFSEEEIKKELNWPAALWKSIEETMKKGMDTQEVKRMSPQLLTGQFWGALMHGMFYIHRVVEENNITNGEIPDFILQDLEDATQVCMTIVRHDPDRG
jgi:TetR/AcrR family transcriptional regulator